MKLSKLIEQMEAVLEQFGDKDVMIEDTDVDSIPGFEGAFGVGQILVDNDGDRFVIVSSSTYDFLVAGP